MNHMHNEADNLTPKRMKSNTSTAYGYDSVGNRTWQKKNNVQTYFTYDAANELTQAHNVTAGTWSYYATTNGVIA